MSTYLGRIAVLCWVAGFVGVGCNDTAPPPRPSDTELAARTDSDGDGYAPRAGDCDDTDSAIHPDATDIPYDDIDQNCDGADAVDLDGDGHAGRDGGGDDCDDLDGAVHPGHAEVPYNGKDDDCSATTADDDIDGDGFGKQIGGDCDDTNGTIYPGATEVPYDDIDQDCSGEDLKDFDGDGFIAKAAGGDDCDDKNHQIHPGAGDYCGDKIDQDCDDADALCSDVDADGDGYSPKDGDCDDSDKEVSPGAIEVPYNGLNDDCDPDTLDDDLDGDGFSQRIARDCRDDDPAIFPGALEIPYDGIDQDCIGGDLVDVDGDGFVSIKVTGGTDCDDLDRRVNTSVAEIPYDEIDQDCIGGDVVTGGAFEVVTGEDKITALDLAFNGTEHLLVWKDATAIKGQRLDAAGKPLGDRIEVLAAGASNGPRVASDGKDFFVVWSHSGNTWEIKGATVSASGAVGPTLDISGGTLALDPRIAWAGGNYVVTWTHLPGSTFLVSGQRLTAAGVKLGASFEIMPTAFLGKSVVAEQTQLLTLSVVPSGLGAVTLTGRLVDGSDGSLQPPAEEPVLIVSDAPRGISTVNGAFHSSQYLVVWNSGSTIDSDIYGQRLNAAGVAIGTSTAENFVISSAFSAQTAPEVAFCGGRYTVVFVDGRYRLAPALMAQHVGADGTLLETNAVSNQLLYAGGATTIGPPRLSCVGSKLLVFWNETVSTGSRISGLLVTP